MNQVPAILAAELSSDSIKLIVIGSFITGGILLYKLVDMIGSGFRTRQIEMSRREIAAYVAEGGMTPETAERLLRAGAPENWSERVAELVAAGSIDSDEAEKLLKAGVVGDAARAAPSPSAA